MQYYGLTLKVVEWVLPAPSVALTICKPDDAVPGTWNVAVNFPVESEVTTVGVVTIEPPSQVNVTVVLGENVVPVAVTFVPTGPLDGESVSAVSL